MATLVEQSHAAGGVAVGVAGGAGNARAAAAPQAAARASGGERILDARREGRFFVTYDAAEASTSALVSVLRAKLADRINGSVLANLDAKGAVYVSFSEKDRSASSEFWRSIASPLEAFLASVPALVRRDLAHIFDGDDGAAPAPGFGASYMFQVQWLTGRKANYWHQDVRWKQHWDAVLFLYTGEAPTPTDLVCPAEQPTTLITPKEYVKHPEGQPEVADAARTGKMPTYRPSLRKGDVIVLDNKLVWHRSPESLTLADEADVADDDALMTIRVKYFPPRKPKAV